MMVRLASANVFGIEATTIGVEVDVQSKIKSFEIVGLPSTAVKESVKRIEAAILNSGLHFPGKRIVVNLAPAGVRKAGTLFDLPIALAILAEQSEWPSDYSDTLFVGELSLDGLLRPVHGAVLIALHAAEAGFKRIVCPFENFSEMCIIESVDVWPAQTLKEALQFLQSNTGSRMIRPPLSMPDEEYDIDFADIKGQEDAKRALEIAAAGGHNILMLGPPGTGKTMLARRLPTILPPMSLTEVLETSKLYSVSGLTSQMQPLIWARPFRSPHHTASDVSIVGGGKIPRPGEVSLAHNGVLFLDEFQEFRPSVLQVLRQPLEDRHITITRAEGSAEFPASFMLVAAMNPLRQAATTDGSWSDQDMAALVRRLSSPLVDRIDLHVQVPKVSREVLAQMRPAETSDVIRDRVQRARALQSVRFNKAKHRTNAAMTHVQVEEYCPLELEAERLLHRAMERFGLSMRSYDKLRKIARTIADLEHANFVVSRNLQKRSPISSAHVAEALQYRVLDRYSMG